MYLLVIIIMLLIHDETYLKYIFKSNCNDESSCDELSQIIWEIQNNVVWLNVYAAINPYQRS